MNIVQIIYSGFGGLGSVAFSLVEADRNKDHRWAIAFVGDRAVDDAYPIRCHRSRVDWAEFRSTPGRPWKSWWALARWLLAIKPDAVIVHSIGSTFPCRVAAWMTGATLVAVEHTANALKSRRNWVTSRLAMVLADHVVVLTPEYKQELAVAHGNLFRSSKTVVIPNGIDTVCFRPADIAEQQTSVVRLGMASRFVPGKRHDVLIRMLKSLKDRSPSVDWRLDLAGDGDSMKEVRELVQELHLDESVHFYGALREEQVASWLQSLNIYVHASDGETLSTSILQAMSTGLPIVASNVPGVRNLLRSGSVYGVVADNSGEHFADRVIEFTNNPDVMREVGSRARDVCVREYSSEKMLDRYIATIDDIADSIGAGCRS